MKTCRRTWLATNWWQESIRQGKAVKLGMENAKATGKPIGRPVMVDKVDAEVGGRLPGWVKNWTILT